MITDKKQIREKLKSIQAFVLDMDGTIYLGDALFPYTHAFLEKLEATGRSYYFFTNNSSKGLSEYIKKLKRMQIAIAPEQMMVSTDVLLDYLASHWQGSRLYVVGTPALEEAFIDAGWVLDAVDPDIVILGFDTTLTYAKLEKACRFIRHGKGYYGINPDLNCPVEQGECIPDCGSMARMIEASTGVYPEFFGKPSPRTLDYIIRKVQLEPRQIAIVGDRLYTDIAVAQDSEVVSILVLSGETSKEDIGGSPFQADILIDSIGALIPLL